MLANLALKDYAVPSAWLLLTTIWHRPRTRSPGTALNKKFRKMESVLFEVFLSETFGSYFILIVDSCGGKFANGILNVTTRSH